MTSDLSTRLAAYLAENLTQAPVSITGLEQFSVGSSRYTYGFEARWTGADGKACSEPLVLRIDPPDPDGSLVPSNMAGEYDWYRAMDENGTVPVPEPILCETDPAALGAPFMIMRRISGAADWDTLFEEDYAAIRDSIGREAFAALGRMAAIDATTLGLTHTPMPVSAETIWHEQLDYWDTILLQGQFAPMPLTRAAIRMLRANPPCPPARIAPSHGDYRFGNFMYGREGIVGLLDWEMAHLSDPHEDLAWTSLETFRPRKHDLVWGFVPFEEGIAAWEQASGLTFDPAVFAWWRVFAHVKATALWVNGARASVDGHSDSVRYLFLNWFNTPLQERWMTKAMRNLAEHLS